MALKSPYDPDDQIYEHLVQSSDLAIPPEELPEQQQQEAIQSMGMCATAASDMFSLGLVLVHMFFGSKKLPSVPQLASHQPIPLPQITNDDDDSNNEAAFLRQSDSSGIQLEHEQLEQLLDLIMLLLQVEPAKHPTAMDALTLRCPCCGQAFVDFSGCFALKCCLLWLVSGRLWH